MLVVIMRHAERGDMSIPKRMSEVEYDPPISHSAPEKIRLAAAELSSFLGSQNIKKARIVTSPFLRCAMTADELAR
jgi:broad specificity phosphatase PhoE